MKIYTSYFAKEQRIPRDIATVSISLWPPRGWSGIKMNLLAPSRDILTEYKAHPDWGRYVERFNAEVLDKLDPSIIIHMLETMGKGRDVCLLCFERDKDHCHRSLVAEWLKKNGASVAGEYPV